MDLRKANAELSDSLFVSRSAFRVPTLRPCASSASTFTVPSSLASLPRTHSNGSPRTAVRYRSYTSGRTITFTMPASSSTSTKMNPFAVSGRWRATTSPATSTHAPCASWGSASLGRREAAELESLVRMIERELELPPSARVHATRRFRREPQPHLPEELAPGEPEAVASSYPHEMLDRGALELGRRAAYEVADARIRAAPLPLDHHSRRRLLAPVPNEPEAYPHDTYYTSPFPGLQLASSPGLNREIGRAH